MSPELAGKPYDTLTTGATIIVTDQPTVRQASRDFTNSRRLIGGF